MIFDDGKREDLASIEWDLLVSLARLHGWTPRQAFLPTNNERVQVPREEARAFGDALAKALDDIPDHDALHGSKSLKLRDVLSPDLADRVSEDVYILMDLNVNAPEWFSGGTKKELIELIELFRENGFCIMAVDS